MSIRNRDVADGFVFAAIFILAATALWISRTHPGRVPPPGERSVAAVTDERFGPILDTLDGVRRLRVVVEDREEVPAASYMALQYALAPCVLVDGDDADAVMTVTVAADGSLLPGTIRRTDDDALPAEEFP